VSGLLSRQGPPGKILDEWLEGQYQLCLSPKTLQELKRVLAYPHIQEKLESGQADMLLKSLALFAIVVEGKTTLNVLKRDPSDNIYLACAVEAKADFLVTGNTEHFREAGRTYQDVRILSPRQFLDFLAEG
jgi:putative PIN family toxin of toxin-antitoxin system